MIVIEPQTAKAIAGKRLYFQSEIYPGILTHEGRGLFCEFQDGFLDAKKEQLREGGGWSLRDVVPEIYDYVKENFPEELI